MVRRILFRLAVCALALGSLLAGPVAEATTGARSPTAVTLIVAAGPGGDLGAMVAAAGGRVVAPALGGRAAVVSARLPDLALRLWREGALVVIGAPAVVAALR
jgi:hypothetical protein